MDVFGLSVPTWRDCLIPAMIASAAIIAATQAADAGFTSIRLQATLTVVPSCSVSSLGTHNEKGADRFPSVTCNDGAAPQIAFSRELLPTNASASLPTRGGGATQPDTDEHGHGTVMTLYFF